MASCWFGGLVKLNSTHLPLLVNASLSIRRCCHSNSTYVHFYFQQPRFPFNLQSPAFSTCLGLQTIRRRDDWTERVKQFSLYLAAVVTTLKGYYDFVLKYQCYGVPLNVAKLKIRWKIIIDETVNNSSKTEMQTQEMTCFDIVATSDNLYLLNPLLSIDRIKRVLLHRRLSRWRCFHHLLVHIW